MLNLGGFHVEWHDLLDSTNARAFALAGDARVELPRLIGATRQTAGRGRGGNSWFSGEGALTFSLLFNPLDAGLPFLRWPQAALATGLAVADTLEEFLPSTLVQLKWPNDVYVCGRKICGILSEVPPGCTDRLVIGIGINVANSFAAAPPDVQATATSLKDFLADAAPSNDDVLGLLLPHWNSWLQRLALGEVDYSHVWKPRCYLEDHRVLISVGSETQSGWCRGLDTDGALLLETERGLQRIFAGTVRRL